MASANPVADLHNRQLDLLERDLVGLAQAMPAELYDSRPGDGAFTGVRTFGEQIRHIATMIYMTAAIVLGEKSPCGPGADDNGPDTVQGKDQILAYLEGSLDYARQAIASLTVDNQLEPLRTYFGTQPRVEVAAGLMYHSYNHYGQMVAHARLRGVVPPSSVR